MAEREKSRNREKKRGKNCMHCIKADDSSDDDDHDVPAVARCLEPEMDRRSYFPFELKDALCDFVDVDFGLLKKLQIYQRLKSVIHYKGCERSYKLMLQLNVIPATGFFNALLETGQQHVVNYVRRWENEHQERMHELGYVDAKCYPLTTQQRCALEENMHELVKLMNLEALLPNIHAARCITRRRREFVEEAPSEFEKATRLLGILLKRSQIDYEIFLNSLDSIGVGHVSRVLREGGAVLTVHVELDDPDAATVEARLETRFKKWTEQSTSDNRHELWTRWSELDADTILMDIKQSKNISVFIHLTTLPALQRLDSALEDGKLKSMLEAKFSILLKGHCCDVRKLQYSVANYNSCLSYFYKTLGCYDTFVLPRPYYIKAEVNKRNHNLALLEWSLELSEVLLVKTTILTFKQLMKSIPSSSADKLAVIALCMVCRRWWSVLTHRSFTRQQIKQTFDFVCRPFRRKIECQLSLEMINEGGAENFVLGGFAVMENQLLVSSYFSRPQISVFDATTSHRQHVVFVSGMNGDAGDIATCGVTRRVYVVDHGIGLRDVISCVRMIDWPSSFTAAGGGGSKGGDDGGRGGGEDHVSLPAREFIVCQGFLPRQLSVGAIGNLLVCGYFRLDPCRLRLNLYVYDVNGTLLRCVQLPDINLTLAFLPSALQVMTAGTDDDDDRYIVCSWRTGWQARKRRPFQRSPWRHRIRSHIEIAEYNAAGQRLRCYTGPDDGLTQVDVGPCSLEPTGDGRFIAYVHEDDFARVLLLDSELRLERVLFNVRCIPRELRYNSQTGHLFLAIRGLNYSTPCIDVYQCRGACRILP